MIYIFKNNNNNNNNTVTYKYPKFLRFPITDGIEPVN